LWFHDFLLTTPLFCAIISLQVGGGTILNERIKKLRKELDLTQQEFADRIGVKRNTIATYEIGRNTPLDAVIASICKEFNVSETWLRTGVGEMFVKQDRESELTLMVKKLLSGESSGFKTRFISVLAGLKVEQWLVLEEKMKEIIGSRADPSAAPAFTPAHTPTIEEQARAEAEQHTQRIYEQILAEKKAQAGLSSGSSGPQAGDGTAKQT